MSAYIVSHNHINEIMNSIVENRSFVQIADSFCIPYPYSRRFHDIEDNLEIINEIGQELVNENCRSVNYRYKRDDTPYKYNFSLIPFAKKLKPIAVIKLIDCLEYQSCETKDYYKTDAFLILYHTRRAITQKFTGYDKAEWSID